MAISGLFKGVRKGLDELESAFAGVAKASPSPNSSLDEVMSSFTPTGVAPTSTQVNQSADELEAMLEELRSVGLSPGEGTKVDNLIEEIDLGDTPLPGGDDEVVDSMVQELSSLTKTTDKSEAEPLLLKIEKEFVDTEPSVDIEPSIFNYSSEDPSAELSLLFEPPKELNKNFLLQADIEEAIPLDVQKVIQILHGTSTMSGTSLQKAVDGYVKQSKGIGISEGEALAMKMVKDNTPLVDLETGNLKAIEFLVLDDLQITADRPNLPAGIDLNRITGGRHPEWMNDLPIEDFSAMGLMAHVRGPGFVHNADDLLISNYITPGPGQEKAIYPTKEIFKSMSPHDILNINFYTKSGDGPVNEALRTDKVDPNTPLGRVVESIQSSLQKLPSWDGGYLYRRAGSTKDVALSNTYNRLKAGDTFTEKAFTSTTRDPMVSVDELGEVSVRQGDGIYLNILPKEEGSRAHGIEGVSEFNFEKEVLYEHGTSFQIDEIIEITPTRKVFFVREI